MQRVVKVISSYVLSICLRFLKARVKLEAARHLILCGLPEISLNIIFAIQFYAVLWK